MTIAVDLDDVICHFLNAFISFHNDAYDTNLCREDFKHYTLTRTIGGTMEEEQQKVHDFYGTDYFKKIEPVEDAKCALEKLKEAGQKLYIVTARHKHKSDDTDKWLTKEFPRIFSGVHYARNNQGERVNKSILCKEIGAVAIIEDSGENALECAENGIKVFLLDLPWNQEYHHENIIRVKSWEDIPEAVNKIKTL